MSQKSEFQKEKNWHKTYCLAQRKNNVATLKYKQETEN